MRKILARAALAGVLILASNGWLLGAANANGSSILEPPTGALLGLYYGAGNLAQTTAKLGRTPPVHLTMAGQKMTSLQGMIDSLRKQIPHMPGAESTPSWLEQRKQRASQSVGGSNLGRAVTGNAN